MPAELPVNEERLFGSADEIGDTIMNMFWSVRLQITASTRSIDTSVVSHDD
jgi:hypothetical protein